TIEVVERTINDADHLTRLEQHLRTRLLDTFLDTIQDGCRLFVTDRQRTVGSAADEAHYPRCLLDQVPAFVVDARNACLFMGLDLDQHVTREKLPLGTALLSR